MKVFCAGFNLYGQFLNINDKCIKSFKSTEFNNAVDLQISHTYLLVKVCDNKCNKIYLHGFFNKPRQMEELVFDDNIVEISVSDRQALFISKLGNIFRLSSNNELKILPNIITTECITKVAAGTCICAAYSNKGYIYNIPLKLDCLISNVKDICCGKEHCLILTENGEIFSFGGGSRGQLGHGDVDNKDVPTQIKTLSGIKIIKIACGAWHSVVLSDTGDIYSWGWDSNGQLGLQTNESETYEHVPVMASPALVKFETNIVNISCGSRHTIALLENHKLYGCGWNKYYQLGFESCEENHYEFKFLYDFSNLEVINLRCGYWNSAVLVKNN